MVEKRGTPVVVKQTHFLAAKIARLPQSGLPAHVSRCAIDLIASMLSTDPVARPTIHTLQEHPLWWEPDVVMAKAKVLYDKRREPPEEVLLTLNMHGADIHWWEKMDPHLLNRVVNFPGKDGV